MAAGGRLATNFARATGRTWNKYMYHLHDERYLVHCGILLPKSPWATVHLPWIKKVTSSRVQSHIQLAGRPAAQEVSMKFGHICSANTGMNA